ncbi:MAG TPA: arginine--tRNA ligase, partial [Chloroflexota bacterium]|nr:arginine--tRNA ligase [Chloroflexota bacterium]
ARIGRVPGIARSEVAPPGHLNLFMDWSRWASSGRAWTAPDAPDRARVKVLIEHTSINPNKAAHVGHLRNACIGDTLCRLFRRLGYSVEVCNYVDDLGNQVADTVVGLLHLPLEGSYRRFGDFCWDVYAGVNAAYQAGRLAPERRQEVLEAVEAGRGNVAWIAAVMTERLVREHLEDMAEFGVTYDLLVWERDIIRQGFWKVAFARLRESPLLQLETEGKYAGCWVLKQPGSDSEAAGAAHGEGFNPDKVLVRSNGLPTYTAKDIAYHLWEFGRLGADFRYRKFAEWVWSSAESGEARPFGRADRVLNVVDRRQEYVLEMVRLALQTLGLEDAAANLHHVRYGVVTLTPPTAARLGVDVSDGRSTYPMAGRQGIGIKVSDLLEHMTATVDAQRPRREGISSREVAAGAIRYHLLRFNLMTEIALDLDQAADLHGNSGVYLMYQHARAAKIRRDAGAAAPGEAAPPFPGQPLDCERLLLRHLASWPETLEQAAAELNVTLLAGYAYDLAWLFSRFYEEAPVLSAAEPLRSFRLWLVSRCQETLADALQVIGLPAPDAM